LAPPKPPEKRNAAGGGVNLKGFVSALAKQGSISFLKKRNKKLLLIARRIRSTLASEMPPKQIKVFWFFFSKKNCLLRACRSIKQVWYKELRCVN
jgi:hypothetical protein